MVGELSEDGRYVWNGTFWMPVSSASTLPSESEHKYIALYSEVSLGWRGLKSWLELKPKLIEGEKTDFQLKAESGQFNIRWGWFEPHFLVISDAGISIIRIGVESKLQIAKILSIKTSSTNTEILVTISWKDILNIYPQKEVGFIIETKSLYLIFRSVKLSWNKPSKYVAKYRLHKPVIENYDDYGISFTKKFLKSPDYSAGFFQKVKEIFDKYKSNGSMSSLGLEIQRSCLTHGVEKLHFRGQFYCEDCDSENYKLIAEDYAKKMQTEQII